MIKKDYEEIWTWHKHIETFNSSGMKPKEFCQEYGIEYKKFSNMRYRIEYKKHSNPDLYRKHISIARKYKDSGEPASKFAKANDVNRSILNTVITHLNYLDIIEELKKEKEKPMNFIKVPNILMSNGGSHLPSLQDTEVLEKQNDLEIIISKGVKVSIVPNIDSMKIIKIIELLKDL